MQGEALMATASRKLHLEILRGVAISCVVFNHTGYYGFLLFGKTHNPVAYAFYLALAILCKIAVPLFFMVSGALLIPRDESLKTVYTKRVVRILAVIVIFSLVQYIYTILVQGSGGFSAAYYLKTMYSSTNLRGSYWFLYSYLALMVMLPWLRRLGRAMTNNEYWYLIILQILFFGFRPVVEYLLHLQRAYLDFPLLASAIFFFLLGYFAEHRLDERFYKLKYVYIAVAATLASIAITGTMTWLTTRHVGRWGDDLAQTYLNNLIVVPTFTMFFLTNYFCRAVDVPPRLKTAILWFGGTAFGIYLVESMFRARLLGIVVHLQPYLHRFASVVVFVVVILLLSAAVTTVLKKLPVFKRLL